MILHVRPALNAEVIGDDGHGGFYIRISEQNSNGAVCISGDGDTIEEFKAKPGSKDLRGIGLEVNGKKKGTIRVS